MKGKFIEDIHYRGFKIRLWEHSHPRFGIIYRADPLVPKHTPKFKYVEAAYTSESLAIQKAKDIIDKVL